MKQKNLTNLVLWVIYIFLLAVLLPHTAWAFRVFEPAKAWTIYGDFTSADLVSYVAALAFECAIAVLTHKLSLHIEQVAAEVRKLAGGWAKFRRQYANAYALGLVVSTMISSLANLAHAVEFGTSIKIFTAWGWPQEIYSLAFGGALPFVSLLFARVLSNVSEAESEEDPAITQAKAAVVKLRQELREAEARAKAAEAAGAAAESRAREAEARFAAAGELMRALVGPDKRERVIAARRQWPQLPGTSISVITGASPSYVSEVINSA